MAVLQFGIDSNNEMKIKLLMHEGESKEDKTYKWANYALHLCIQLNYIEKEYNPFSEDQGCYIHFLSDKIMTDNNLNIYGYEKVDDDIDQFGDFDFELEFDDGDLTFDRSETSFIPQIEEISSILSQNQDYINILLDQNEAVQFVGGLSTLTSTSATIIHEALKESAQRLSKK